MHYSVSGPERVASIVLISGSFCLLLLFMYIEDEMFWPMGIETNFHGHGT